MFNYCLIYSVKNDMLEMEKKKKIKEDKSREGAYIITVVLQAPGSWMLGIELEELQQTRN
jgi:methenyltetrahydromethanopterin cyclohydrolase